MDALIENFAEVDETWRTSALELAWLQHFSKTWTSLPEWDFKCPSIIPDNMDVSLLVSSERGPCPLCSQSFVTENNPYCIKKHMKFHTKHSISHDGNNLSETTPQKQLLGIKLRCSDLGYTDPSASTLVAATPTKATLQQRSLSIIPRGSDPVVAAVATPPALQSLLKCSSEDDLQGYVDPADFSELLTLFCAKTNTEFVKVSGKSLSTTDYKSTGHLIKWQAVSSHGPKIPYLGMPFMVILRATYECHHGPSHVKPKQQSTLQNEHSYSGKHRRSTSKKVACPAKAYVKKIAVFTDSAFRLEKSQARSKVVKNLTAAIARNENLSVSYRVYVKFPAVECHEGHGFDEVVGALAALSSALAWPPAPLAFHL
ncbi:hypothetical protein CAPTEDRAFT_208382 [Capitella teleta]|uniref:Uncharacterized protein n=1 Tax=Capitella teleta TaxID=283909 RepID=R7UK51_CAPTE|nr:hypothetical protein CAPTEDRAFT_208382 [Capitella teleta]|eukprot:ELU06473.1 hypothetical protein CAPTEDRAFT_208382 [Capitella teleta]